LAYELNQPISAIANFLQGSRSLLAKGENHRLRNFVTRGEAESRAENLVSVADSGPGISAAVGGRLFRPFVSTKKDGLGVGLSILRAIIEGHGGDIWVEPNIDGGAVFKFILPAVGRREAADAR